MLNRDYIMGRTRLLIQDPCPLGLPEIFTAAHVRAINTLHPKRAADPGTTWPQSRMASTAWSATWMPGALLQTFLRKVAA